MSETDEVLFETFRGEISPGLILSH